MSEIHEFIEAHPYCSWNECEPTKPQKVEPSVNNRGNKVIRGQWISCDDDSNRYHFDSMLSTKKGWRQYDTDQDAWYFGVWVHMEKRLMFTYAEGDLILVECPTIESFKAELDNAEKFYGSAPPFAVGLDIENGTVTNFYDKRPSSEEVK